MRPTVNQFVTRVACGHRSRTCIRLPVWSPSSCDRYTQRTSAGSTNEKARSIHASPVTARAVSTITGSAPVMTMLLTGTWSAPSSKYWRMT
jgi:hypothetical protein